MMLIANNVKQKISFHFSWELRNISCFTLFAISNIQFAKVYYKINDKIFPFCQEISVTYYCKTIAILLRNSAILLTYCSIEYCNSAIPQHYCYCYLQYSEKLLAVSLNLFYRFDAQFLRPFIRFFLCNNDWVLILVQSIKTSLLLL